MNIESRLKTLEEHFHVLKNTIPYEDLVRWFKMMAEERGAGHATQAEDFTPEDWKWYKEFVEKTLKKNYSKVANRS